VKTRFKIAFSIAIMAMFAALTILPAGCAPQVLTTETAAPETAAETEAVASETAAETEVPAMTEESWLESLKDKWKGKEISVLTTAFCSAADIDEEFMALTGAKVNLITTAYAEFDAKFKATLAAKSAEGMDVYLADDKYTGLEGANGWYVPLQDMIFESDKADIIPANLAMYTYKDNGDLVAIPYLAMSYLLFYNDAMLKAGGYDTPPKTWEELKTVSMDLQKQGIAKYGMSMHLKTDPIVPETWAVIVVAMGGKWYNDDGTPAFNSEAGLKAMNYIIDGMYKDKWINPSSTDYLREDAIQPFIKGEDAFHLTWQFMWPMVKDEANSKVVKDAKFAVVPSESGATASSWISGGGFVVNPYSNNIDVAKDYVKFFCAKKFALTHFEKRGYLPMWKSMYEDPKAAEIEPDIKILMDALAFSTLRPSTTWYGEALDIQVKEIPRAFTKEITPEQALKNAEDAILQRIEENWE